MIDKKQLPSLSQTWALQLPKFDSFRLLQHPEMVRYLAFESQSLQSITSFVNWSQKESIILSASYDLILRVNDKLSSAYERDCLLLKQTLEM